MTNWMAKYHRSNNNNNVQITLREQELNFQMPSEEPTHLLDEKMYNKIALTYYKSTEKSTSVFNNLMNKFHNKT